MGAGASIDDEDDMKKQFEKQKGDGTLSAEQASALQKEYDDLKATKKGDNEFLVIGKMNKAYDKIAGGGGGGGGGAAAPAPAPAPAPAEKKSYPKPPEGFTCKAGPNAMECVSMKDIEAAIKRAQDNKLTPLIIDRSEAHAFDTFLGYSATIIDAKKVAINDIAIKKQPVPEVMDGVRKTICNGMKYGKRVALACQTSAPNFVGQLCDGKNGADLTGKPYEKAMNATEKKVFPLDLFDDSARKYANEAEMSGAEIEAFFREEDVADTQGFAKTVGTFNVIVTTQFNYEDIDDFLFKDDAPSLPPGKFQAIWIAHEDDMAFME